MAYIRVEFETTREKARRFDRAVVTGSPFTDEKQRAIDQAWSLGYIPTGAVRYRGITNGQPPSVKCDVDVDLSTYD